MKRGIQILKKIPQFKSRQMTQVIRNFSSETKKADFGFREVNSDDKERLVKGVFSSVASKYDIMNDLMSGGVHRLWKDEFVNMIGINAAAKVDPNYVPRHLDVAGGTGDIAFRSALQISKAYNSKLHEMKNSGELDEPSKRPIIVCDINPEMLAVGKDRASSQVGHDNLKLVMLTIIPNRPFLLI